ncbi:MAG TPA: J domain-containing protein [Fimbriimonadaceae bacterium]|jgi:hypothetical protein
MSLGKRAYNVLRGYVSTEWDRIKGLEHELAERELGQSPPAAAPAPTSNVTSTSEQLPIIPRLAPDDKKAYARRLLGVAEGCSFEDVRKAFARLNKRSDPANFPNESPEAVKAADIQRKVAWAYNILTEGMDATERRFRTLELD